MSVHGTPTKKTKLQITLAISYPVPDQWILELKPLVIHPPRIVLQQERVKPPSISVGSGTICLVVAVVFAFSGGIGERDQGRDDVVQRQSDEDRQRQAVSLVMLRVHGCGGGASHPSHFLQLAIAPHLAREPKGIMATKDECYCCLKSEDWKNS
jgi:hypothetical protein